MTDRADQGQDRGSGFDVDAALNAAGKLIRSKRYASAEAVLTQVLSRDNGHSGAWYLLGMARFRAGDAAGAEQAYRMLVEQAPTNANGHYGLGLALMQLGRRDEAAVAFEAALQARPGFVEAAHRLQQLRGTATPPVPDAGWTSLAEMLDVRTRRVLNDDELAGKVRWAGRPFPASTLPGLVAALAAVVLLPRALRLLAEPLAASSQRDTLAQLWRLAEALRLPLIALIPVVSVAWWLARWYAVRDRRLEVTQGVLRRRHVVLWYHDLERQPVVEQTLLDQLLGFASIALETNALLLTRSARRSRLGRLYLRGLRHRTATELAAVIRQATLQERRRMIQTFISTR